MSDFQLDDDYVDVAERIRIFREKYPDGSLRPARLEEPFTVVACGGQMFVAYTAAAYRTPDDPCPGIGSAWKLVPGPTPFTKGSELMNAETSAWGRAIVAALAADTKKVASRDEIEQSREYQPAPAPRYVVSYVKAHVATEHEEAWVKAQNYVWPWTLDTCNEIEEHLEYVGAGVPLSDTVTSPLGSQVASQDGNDLSGTSAPARPDPGITEKAPR